MEPQTGTDPPKPPPRTTAPEAHYVAGNTACLHLQTHYLARALRPTPAPLPPSPGRETARGGWGGPLAPLALTLSAAVPSAPLVSLPPGRAGPPVRHSTTPPPCPGGPSPRLPWPPRRRAIGCPPTAAAAPLAVILCPSKPSYATFVRTWRSEGTTPKPAAQGE